MSFSFLFFIILVLFDYVCLSLICDLFDCFLALNFIVSVCARVDGSWMGKREDLGPRVDCRHVEFLILFFQTFHIIL